MFVRLPLRDPARNQKSQPSMSNISDSSSPQGAGRPGVRWEVGRSCCRTATGLENEKKQRWIRHGVQKRIRHQRNITQGSLTLPSNWRIMTYHDISWHIMISLKCLKSEMVGGKAEVKLQWPPHVADWSFEFRATTPQTMHSRLSGFIHEELWINCEILCGNCSKHKTCGFTYT